MRHQISSHMWQQFCSPKSRRPDSVEKLFPLCLQRYHDGHASNYHSQRTTKEIYVHIAPSPELTISHIHPWCDAVPFRIESINYLHNFILMGQVVWIARTTYSYTFPQLMHAPRLLRHHTLHTTSVHLCQPFLVQRTSSARSHYPGRNNSRLSI